MGLGGVVEGKRDYVGGEGEQGGVYREIVFELTLEMKKFNDGWMRY